MFRVYRLGIAASILLIFLGLVSRPASAQVRLDGYWHQKFSEDQPERGPGPEIGDYTGLPINEADRHRADAWDAQKWEVVEHECDPHPADYAPRGPADLVLEPEMGSVHARSSRLARDGEILAEQANDLAGRPPPSLRERAAYLAGLLNRGMGGRHAESDHHSPEGRVGSPERPCAQ